MGFVYFVGAGPGDVELITLKGIRALKKADVVLFDSLANDELLDYTKPDCREIYVGKRSGVHSKKQEEINKILLEEAKGNNVVVRLKGGDSFVFGRGSEEAQVLDENNIAYAFVPGVSSCLSVPELAGIPVTHRELSRSFTVVTGHTKNGVLDEEYIKKLATLNTTLVFLMGLSNLEKISNLLMKHGLDKNTPCSVISNGSLENQVKVTATLETIYPKVKENEVKPPAIIVVGKTAGFDFSKKINVGLTGSEKIQQSLKREIDFANTFDLLDAKINKLDFEVDDFSKYDLIAFLSAKAVDIFCEKYGAVSNVSYSAIGSQTKGELEKFGIKATVVPDDFTGVALGKEIAKRKYKSVLAVRCKRGSDDIDEVLKQNNISFDTVFAYDTVFEKGKDFENYNGLNYVTFSSTQGVKEFFKHYEKRENIKYVAIGSVTAKALEGLGIAPIVAKEFTAKGIANAILEDIV